MRKILFTLAATLSLCFSLGMGVSALSNDMLKVGLKYGSEALFSANLQNYTGSGYTFGYYESDRSFMPLATTEETKLSMTVDGTVYVSGGTYSSTKPTYSYETIGGYHAQFTDSFDSFAEAHFVALQFRSAFVAYVGNSFYVRSGNYLTKAEAEEQVERLSACTYTTIEGESYPVESAVVSPSKTAVSVTQTGTTNILFEFDCSGLRNLGIMAKPLEEEKTITWFKGYRYYGGFEYQRVTGGNINVVNVVDLEDYVKCVIPYEMSNTWPIEALKAQSVCARTYATRQTRHRASGFDVCSTTDCQVYQGASACNEHSDEAVDQTRGVKVYYGNSLADTVYYSANGGASEDAENVWGSAIPYLIGKPDPYEGDISDFAWTVSFTASELTSLLKTKGYTIGTIQDLYVSEWTEMGNVKSITFVDTTGKKLTVHNEKCRTIFNGVYSGKSVKSMRYQIENGSSSTEYYLNDKSNKVSKLQGLYAIFQGGTVQKYDDTEAYVLTAEGSQLLKGSKSGGTGTFTLSGGGHGHNVGMSQWGAKAMAERGLDYEDILHFYYTDIQIHD